MSENKPHFHEDYSRADKVKAGSDRSFGIVFCIVFALIGLWPLLGVAAPRWWALAIAAAFLVISFTKPILLAPFNRLWHRFGLLLHRIVTPVILGLIFYVAVTPTGLIMRALGKDLLRLRFEPEAGSYWIERQPPGPDPETMRKQF